MNDVIVQKLKEKFPESIDATNNFRGDLTVQVKKNDIVKVGEFLKNDPELSFDLIVDLLGVDMYRPEGRFEVVYNIYSIKNSKYVRLKVLVDEDDCEVPTVTDIWPGANWHERETFDMIGVKFTGHPDLRRMYMPEEYEYHPLRKDFPLMGIPDSIPLPRK
ncbi:MAG: NADH-quinone oxidoreductase subunit C [Bacteroidetes bacterium]|nr:NADH-quinone oxidoreductase subunit C [Bacteroidota bacterium]MCW5894280.1 NADH-quinone oxidoreductase subunit C [Bacteroidota bacterium]